MEPFVPSRITPSYLRALRDNPFPTSIADTAISGTLQTREYQSFYPGRSAATALSSARERLRRHYGLSNDVPSPGERQLDFTNYGVWGSERPKKKKKGERKRSSLLDVVSSDDDERRCRQESDDKINKCEEVDAATSTGNQDDDDDDKDDAAAADRYLAWFMEQQRANDSDENSDEAVYWTSDSSDRDTESENEGEESENEGEENERTELTEPCLDGAEEQVIPAAAQEGQSISSSPDGGSLDLGSFAGDAVPCSLPGDLLEAQESDDEETEREE